MATVAECGLENRWRIYGVDVVSLDKFKHSPGDCNRASSRPTGSASPCLLAAGLEAAGKYAQASQVALRTFQMKREPREMLNKPHAQESQKAEIQLSLSLWVCVCVRGGRQLQAVEPKT